MKKSMLMTIFMVCAIGLTACGNISDKVIQKSDSVEIGESFDLSSVFEIDDSITISLKDTNIDMSIIGSYSIDLVISDGKKKEEKTYLVNVVDTQAPVINSQDITIYVGSEFNAEELATASDNSGEIISVTIKYNDVDTSTAGMYSIIYEASDSSGNLSEKSTIVEVMSIATAEDVMDLIDKHITKEGFNDFTYNKNTFDAVFVTAPRLSTLTIDSGRKVMLYPEIYICNDIFSISSDFPNGKYGVVGICFRFEYSDKTNDMRSRYSLYSNKITVSSGTNVFTNVFSGIPEASEFEKAEYLSRFSYTLNPNELKNFELMLDKGSVVFAVDTVDRHYDMSLMKVI